jgi:hypothetical protein
MPGPEEEFDEDTPDATNRDLYQLQRFVLSLTDLLEAIIDDGRHIPSTQVEDVRAAWPEAKADLENLVRLLTYSSESDNLSERTNSLRAHGLTGKSLRMKLKGWRSRFYAFGRRMNRPWLRSVLRWSDSILGSLVDALSAGALGKEFKEAIENFLADAASDS